MAESQPASSPLPAGVPSPSPSPSKNEQIPSVQKRSDQRHNRKTQPRTIPQIDGTVSDSVTNPTASASARSKKAPKQRQQSVAVGAGGGALPPNHQNGRQKARPVSVGGSMLLAPTTPLKEQAYAGPTFQASPAPSSLPVPKFFSRSVPNIAAQQSLLDGRMEGDRTPEKEKGVWEEEEEGLPEESDGASPGPSSMRAAVQSPLDIFFKADKADKEKSRSGSMLSPDITATRPVAPAATEQGNPFQQSSGKSVFLRELDGHGDEEAIPSPKTIPHSSNQQQPQSTQRGTTSPGIRVSSAAADNGASERENATKSLKDLLFNTNANPTAPHHPRAHSNPRSTFSPSSSSSSTPSQRPTSGPSTPTPTQQNHYTLHYGNRDLSPLFKAVARSNNNETPSPRPSGLRQQQELNTDEKISTRQLPQIDPDSFSRVYLDQQIRNPDPQSRAPPPPRLPPNTTTSSSAFANASSSSTVPQHSGGGPTTSTATAPSAKSPRTASSTDGGGGGGGTNDIRTMEDDLKRMLNLNVLSN